MDIYQHFREEERPLIDQMISWRDEVDLKYQRKLSDFLNPREHYILKTVIGNHADLVLGCYGGPDNAERVRAIIAPDYEIIEKEDYQITLLEANYPEKFITIEHRDVLGAFMSSGIKREKLGDLVVRDGTIQMIIASEISDFIKVNITSIKKANVQFTEKPLHALMEPNETWRTKDTTVSSLRLDVIVKEIYGMPRKKAVMHIEAGHVKVNFRTVDVTSFQLEEGDLLSLRGKGRSRLDSIHGMTKKEKVRVTVSHLN